MAPIRTRRIGTALGWVRRSSQGEPAREGWGRHQVNVVKDVPHYGG